MLMIGGQTAVLNLTERELFLWLSLRFEEGFLLFSRERVLH